MAIGDADVLMILDGPLGVDVIYEPGPGAQPCRGLYVRAVATDLDAQSYGVSRTQHTVDVPLDAITGLAEDRPITVDGRTYVTRFSEASDHPRLTRVHLAEVR